MWLSCTESSFLKVWPSFTLRGDPVTQAWRGMTSAPQRSVARSVWPHRAVLALSPSQGQASVNTHEPDRSVPFASIF